MSAYIVSRNHILYLVIAATSRRILGHHSHAIGWYHGGQWHELKTADYDRSADVANMLWRENIASVSARYPGESSGTLPGPRGENFVIEPHSFHGAVHWDDFDPVQLLKACNCYEYQSCEHDAWEESEAHAFVRALCDHAVQALPGYDDAEWGCPPTLEEKRAEHRKIRSQGARFLTAVPPRDS